MKTKILLMMLIGMILVLPLCSAFEFDNIKSVDYDKMSLGYPEITIKNSFAWIIPLDPILNTKIVEHDTYCASNCKSIQEIKLYYETSLVDSVIFQDREGNEIDVPYKLYLIEYETYTERGIDYKASKQICNELENKSQSCSWDYVYKDIEKTKEVKIPYTEGEKLPIGTYKLEININKDSNIDIDYIYTTNGKTLNEMAWINQAPTQLIIENSYSNLDTTLWNNYTTAQGQINFSDNKLQMYGKSSRVFIDSKINFTYGSFYTFQINITGCDVGEQFYFGTTLSPNNYTTNDPIGGNGLAGSNGTYVGIYGEGSLGAGVTNVSLNTKLDDLISVGVGNLSYFTGTHSWRLTYNVTSNIINLTRDGVSAGSITKNLGSTFGRPYIGGNPYCLQNISSIYVSNNVFNTTLMVTPSYPADTFKSNSNTVNVGCNYTGLYGGIIRNVTLNVWNSSNYLSYTNTESGLNSLNYNKTWTTSALTDDTYHWNCGANGAYWSVDTANNIIVVDKTGKNNGTATNVTINSTFARWGNGGSSYNGNNSRVQFNNASILSASLVNSSSFSIWVKTNTDNNSLAAIRNRDAFYIMRDAVRSKNTDGTFNTFTSETTISEGWKHITYIVDTNVGFHSLYINGVLSQNSSVVGKTLSWHTESWDLGTRRGVGNFWNGLIDEVRIFNRTLSPSEITSLYTSNTIADTTGLVAYYDFEDTNIFTQESTTNRTFGL
jgi:hypothetical protein